MNAFVVGKKVGRFWGEQKFEVVKQQISKTLGGAGGRLAGEEASGAPVATGKLRSRIRVERKSPFAVAVVADEPYGIMLEHGSDAHYPRMERLIEWVEAKIGASGNEAVRIAFAIAEDQSHLGIEPKEWWWSTFESLLPVLNSQYLGPLGAAIVRDL